MGAFNINITGVGGHGCERKAKPGEKLYQRCGRFTCPDCMAYEFVQRMKQAGMVREGDTAYTVEVPADHPDVLAMHEHNNAQMAAVKTEGAAALAPERNYAGPIFLGSDDKFYRRMYHDAAFTHWPKAPTQVVDDMLKNERKSGQF